MKSPRSLNLPTRDVPPSRIAEPVARSVSRLYMSHPFPQWTKETRHHVLASELCRYRYLGLTDALRGGRILDAGCGTGNRTIPAAKELGAAEMVGLDLSTESLRIARQVAREEHFDRLKTVQGSVLKLPLPDASFDVVVSWGVLHHTSDPFQGLCEMVRVCRPGGFVGIYLYNKWNHWRHNLQKERVSRLAGPDIEKRFEIAHRLYGKKPVEDMTREEVAVFYDQYCHPHKSDHTFGETLQWFRTLGLEYSGSFPPLRSRDLIACLQYRGDLSGQFPLSTRLTRFAVAVSRRLPSVGKNGPPFDAPNRFHLVAWQALFAWMGRHGEYSAGAALAARKPVRA